MSKRPPIMQLPLLKKCTKCGETKLRTEFYADPRYVDGVRGWCKDCHRVMDRRWIAKNQDERAAYLRQWHQDNAERRHKNISARCRERWHNDPEYRKRKNRQGAIKEAKRRMAIKNSANSLTLNEWNALCAKYDYRCLACGEKKPLTVDHVIPLSRGGSNSIDNVQPLCKSCNGKKHTKTIDYRNREAGG